MNALTRNNFLMDWPLAYVGITKDWLSVGEALSEISPEELGKLNSEIIASLYAASEKSKESFLSIIKEIANINDDTLSASLRIWGIAYLEDIMKSFKTVSDKLKAVADVWAMVDYPEEWKPFIYYMPAPSRAEASMDLFYKKFTEFLKTRKLKLRE
jgi:hypothetical protein